MKLPFSFTVSRTGFVNSVITKLSEYWYIFCKPFRKIKYFFLYRFSPKHQFHVVRTTLKPGYYDVDERMLQAAMALLVEYVEQEFNNGIFDLEEYCEWCSQEDTKTDNKYLKDNIAAAELYRWWKEKRPTDYKIFEDFRHQLFVDYPGKNPKRLWPIVPLKEKRKLYAMEKRLRATDQKMLHKLIDIRESLWT